MRHRTSSKRLLQPCSLQSRLQILGGVDGAALWAAGSGEAHLPQPSPSNLGPPSVHIYTCTLVTCTVLLQLCPIHQKQLAPALWWQFGEAQSPQLSLWYTWSIQFKPKDKLTDNPGVLMGVFIRKKSMKSNRKVPKFPLFFLTMKSWKFQPVLTFWLQCLMLALLQPPFLLLCWCLPHRVPLQSPSHSI